MSIVSAYRSFSLLLAVSIPIGCSSDGRDVGVAADGGGGIVTGGSNMSTTDGSESGPEAPPPKLDLPVNTPGADGDTGEECAGLTEMAENQIAPADIIIVVDNSGSMQREAEFVGDNLSGLNGVMPGFSQLILESGVDPRVVLLSSYPSEDYGVCIEPPLGGGGCPESDSNPPAFLHIDQWIGSTDALERIIATHDQWAGIMRPEAVKHVVVVSDDNSLLSATDFDTMFRGLDPSYENYRFHGIYSFAGPGFLGCFGSNDPCCNLSAAEGTQYRDLVGLRMGVEGNLCEQDFEPVFEAISTSVVESAQLSCEWEIPDPPEGEILNPNQVNVLESVSGGTPTTIGKVESVDECADVQDGWYFDNPDEPTKILVCPQTCSRLQGADSAAIEIEFGCATQPAG